MKCNSGRRLETKWCWFSLETSMMLLNHFLHILTTGQRRCLVRPQNAIASASCAHNTEWYRSTINIDPLSVIVYDEHWLAPKWWVLSVT